MIQKQILLPVVAIVSVLLGFGLGYLVFAPLQVDHPKIPDSRESIQKLQEKNISLRDELRILRAKNLQLAAELESLIAGQRSLEKKLEDARQEQENLSKDRTRLSKDLDRLRRPLSENIYSSTVRTVIKPDETLLTGGFQGSDGRRMFMTMKPHWTTNKGVSMIEEEHRIFLATDEQLKAAGLENMITNAGNVMQHGELWQSVNFRDRQFRTSLIQRSDRSHGLVSTSS